MKVCLYHAGGLLTLHRPAHHTARIEVEHDRQLGKALQGANVDYVRARGTIWHRDSEVSGQRVIDNHR